MASVRITREGITLRFGESDTPAPEGAMAANPPPRIVVALNPVDPRAKVSVLLRSDGRERALALRAGRRTREEQFFEGSFPDLRGGDRIEYSVRVELEREGKLLRLDSLESPNGVRSVEITGGALRRRDAAAPSPVEASPALRAGAVVAARLERPGAGPQAGSSGPFVPGGVGSGIPGGAGGATSGGGANGAGTFKVSGTIALEHGLPASKVKVRLYQVGFGGTKTFVGEAQTNEQGGYELPYTARGAANIEVHAIAADGKEVQLSRTKFGAAADEKLDLVAPTKLQPAAAEFTRLRSAVSGQLAKPEDLAKAVERGERRDISLLASATGWDGRAVALASTAYEHAETTKIPADALYALYRSGFPTEPRALARIDGHSVETALRQAGQAGIIDATAVEAASGAFREFAATERLKFKVPGTLSSRSDFAGCAGVSAADRQAFLGALKDTARTDLWQRATQAGVSAKGVETLKLQGKLAYLTANNADLTDRVQPKLTSGDARQLIELDYDRPEKWKDELTSMAGGDKSRLSQIIPPAFEGVDADDRLDSYADELSRRVRQMDPNRVTMRRLSRGDLDGLPAGARARVEGFLGNASQKGFKLGQTAFSSFVAEHGEGSLLPGLGLDEKKAAIADVKALHRLYSLAPSDKTLNVLLKAGFKSAYDIVGIPYDDFIRRYSPEVGSTRETQQLYWKAQQQSATIVNVFTGARRLDSRVATNGTAAIGQAAQSRLVEIKKKLQGRFPTLETLFGNVDYCECEHCRSVLSPAAYLVDILHFIDPRGPQWDVQKSLWKMRSGGATEYTKPNPFGVLLNRRPDLPHIPLTCENTNTTLPYIDVVNEILELLVTKGTPGTEAFDTGSASSQDLLAEPQNITWEAYTGAPGQKGLVEFVYPSELPFDLPLEMVRAMLSQLGVPLWKLREFVARPTALAGPAGTTTGLCDVWFERIGLSPAEVKVLAGEHPWHELYGYANETDALEGLVDTGTAQRAPSTSLRSAKNLSRRLGVTYKELVELVKTAFVNPEVDRLVVLRKLEIDPHDVNRYFATSPSEQLSPPEKSAFEVRLLALKDRYPSFDPSSLRALWTDAVREKVLVLRSPDVGCDFSETTLGFAKAPANDAAAMALVLLKLSVFVRLRKKLGWSTPALDRALQVFVRPDVETLSTSTWAATLRTALMYVAHLVELGERTGHRVSDEELLTLWAPIGITGESSLYERLFLTRSVLSLAPVFDHPVGAYLQGSTELISNHTDAVAQALQISHEEIEQIFAYAGIQGALLSIDNLSLLMRHKVCAKALDVSVAQLLVLLGLTATKPLQPIASATLQDVKDDVPYWQTLAFVREVELLRSAGLDVDILDAATRHRGPLIDDRAREQLVEQVFLALAALPKTGAAGEPSSATPAPTTPGGDSQSRERLAAIQALAAQLGAPEPLVTKLAAGLLRDAGSGAPLLEPILASQRSGLPSDGTSWVAFVWFAAGGTYKVATPAGAGGTLAFGPDGEARSVANLGGVFELTDVRAGQRYRLELTLQSEGEVTIQGDSLPKGPLSSLTAASVDSYGRFATAVAILQKSLDLLRALDFGEPELEHVRSFPNALDLVTLPVVPSQNGKAIFERLLPWIEVAAARRHFAVGSGVLDVFGAARRAYDVPNQKPVFEAALAGKVAFVLGRRPELVQAGLKALNVATNVVSASAPFVYEVPELRTGAGLQRVADSIAALVRLGLNPNDVVGWATKPIDAAVATKVRGALKGRYAPDAWRRVARPIFDVLRKKQRDALVAHLTHLPNAPYGETPEQLYEYLLLDSGMEPPVLTSRIQLAISSVQLFALRCLMNLETDVDPGIIDAKRWEWMRRYRVWEANRKIFLWPENWLEPEFRDDKTHLFRELESALLQGDVSDDLVRTALHTYLKGLEGIARLELMTMFFEPGVSADGSTIHLIGRTQNEPYKYFYRKCSHTMWTPWEPLGVEIEGEHLALTLWRGRLHLFWVGIFERGEEKPTSSESLETISKKTSGPSDLRADRAVQLQLSWVERTQDKWGNRSSTSLADAPNFKNCGAADAEARRKFFVHVKVDSRNTASLGDDILEVHVAHHDGAWKKFHRYKLISTLAPPVLENQGGTRPSDPGPVVTSTPRATKWQGAGPLRVDFKYQDQQGGKGEGVASKTFDILSDGGAYKLLFPTNEIRMSLGEATPPAAAGKASGYIFWPQGAQHVVYRGTDGAIHDVWWTKNGWFHTDASGAADADAASADPHGYPLSDQHVHCVTYCAGPKLIELSWSQVDSLGPDADSELDTAWRADVLYEAPQGGAKPVGRPLGGVFTPNRGVVYRLDNNQLSSVVQAGIQGAWTRNLLNGGTLPQAASDPTGFVMSETALDVTTILSRHIFFRGTDGHVHELMSDATGASWQYQDLTAATGAPAAAGNPAGYPFLGQKTLHVVYRGADGTVHELWRDATTWHHNPIGNGSPKAKSDPAGFVLERTGTQHVVYRGEDDHVHELWWDSGGWHHNDLTTATKDAPLADGDPTGYAFEQQGTQHVVYRAPDKGLCELWWSDIWRLGRFELDRPRLDDVGPLISPFFYEDQSEPHTFFVEPSLAERTVQDWEEYVVTTEQYTEVRIPQIIIPIPYFPEVAIPFLPADVGLLDVRVRPKDWMFRDDILLGVGKGVFGQHGGVGTSGVSPRLESRVAGAVVQPSQVVVSAKRGVPMERGNMVEEMRGRSSISRFRGGIR
jgi:hypothetical protein